MAVTLAGAFEQILAAARAGDQEAWSALYLDLAGPVRGYLAGRGSPDPEDQAAETFLDVARGIGRFSGDESDLRSWVFSIAHRRMVDAHRRAAVRPVSVADANEIAARVAMEPSAEAVALLHEESATAAELLAGLTDDQRDVLLLRVVAGLSVRETADALGKGESAVKVTQHRALAALRARVAPRS